MREVVGIAGEVLPTGRRGQVAYFSYINYGVELSTLDCYKKLCFCCNTEEAFACRTCLQKQIRAYGMIYQKRHTHVSRQCKYARNRIWGFATCNNCGCVNKGLMILGAPRR